MKFFSVRFKESFVFCQSFSYICVLAERAAEVIGKQNFFFFNMYKHLV